MPQKPEIVTITVASAFSASHWHDKTLNEPAHSHNFRYEAALKGALNDEGYLVDFREIEACLKKINTALEGKDLNALLRYPTTENLVIYLYNEIKKTYPQLIKVTLWEKDGYYASYGV